MTKKQKKNSPKKPIQKAFKNPSLDKQNQNGEAISSSNSTNQDHNDFIDAIIVDTPQGKESSNLEDDFILDSPSSNINTTSNAKSAAESKSGNNKKGVFNKYDLALGPEPSQNINNKPARVFSLIIGTLALIGVIFIGLQAIPNVLLGYTDDAVATRKKVEAESKSKQKDEQRKKDLEDENRSLTFTDRKVDMTIKDFGTLKISLYDKAAPKTAENFIRLVHRGFYDGLSFHRIVKQPNFNVIQGGDPDGTGQGGETADGGPLIDELWEVKPEFAPQANDAAAQENTQGTLINTPKFKDASLYKNFDPSTGQVTYQKGQILMAKTSAPDSATSQFFITLSDINLPAQYTIFGTINPDDFPVLDKIQSEVNPVAQVDPAQAGSGTQGADGKPDKELKMEKVVLE